MCLYIQFHKPCRFLLLCGIEILREIFSHYFLLKYCKDDHSPSILVKNKSLLLERRTIVFFNILRESCIITLFSSGRLSGCKRILPLSSYRGVERRPSTMFCANCYIFFYCKAAFTWHRDIQSSLGYFLTFQQFLKLF